MVKVGVTSAPLKAVVPVDLVNTTPVPAVTAPLKVALRAVIRVKLLALTVLLKSTSLALVTVRLPPPGTPLPVRVTAPTTLRLPLPATHSIDSWFAVLFRVELSVMLPLFVVKTIGWSGAVELFKVTALKKLMLLPAPVALIYPPITFTPAPVCVKLPVAVMSPALLVVKMPLLVTATLPPAPKAAFRVR